MRASIEMFTIVFDFFVTANWTGVTATFVFERIYSYFIYHVYAPSVIVVILSWVGFVLPRDTPPARVTLGVTAVLTIVTILTMLNSSVAKVELGGTSTYLIRLGYQYGVPQDPCPFISFQSSYRWHLLRILVDNLNYQKP